MIYTDNSEQELMINLSRLDEYIAGAYRQRRKERGQQLAYYQSLKRSVTQLSSRGNRSVPPGQISVAF